MNTISSSLNSQIEDSINILEKKNSMGNSDGLLAKFILQNNRINFSWKVNCANQEWVSEKEDLIKAGNFTELSNLGFSLFLDNSKLNEYSNLFRDSIQTLRTKNNFPEDRVSFPFYPKQFLGIVLGITISNDSESINWIIKEIIPKRQSFGYPDNLNRYLNLLIQTVAHDKIVDITKDEIDKLDSIEELSFMYWARTRGFFKLFLNEEQSKELKEKILESFLAVNLSSINEWCIPFVLSTVLSCMYESVNSIILDTNHVSKILQNFESGMKRWRFDKNRKWAIENEYDIQSILYLMLRPYFEDIEYEDPTSKFGHKSSRVDFKLPSLRTIIEVKYIRKPDEFVKIEGEIKNDSIDYVQSTGYQKIIVFVYDSTSSVQDHQTTISALRKIDGIEDVIIASKPSQIK